MNVAATAETRLIMSRDRQSFFEVLTHSECVAFLDQEEVGRIAWTAESRPTLVPVNYAWDGEAIVVRTDPGTKLLALHEAEVAFEIDRIDRNRKEGWSVVVQGTAIETPLDQWPASARRPDELYLQPWAPGAKMHWVRVLPRVISGRRIRRLSELDIEPFWLLSTYASHPDEPRSF